MNSNLEQPAVGGHDGKIWDFSPILWLKLDFAFSDVILSFDFKGFNADGYTQHNLLNDDDDDDDYDDDDDDSDDCRLVHNV